MPRAHYWRALYASPRKLVRLGDCSRPVTCSSPPSRVFPRLRVCAPENRPAPHTAPPIQAWPRTTGCITPTQPTEPAVQRSRPHTWQGGRVLGERRWTEGARESDARVRLVRGGWRRRSGPVSASACGFHSERLSASLAVAGEVCVCNCAAVRIVRRSSLAVRGCGADGGGCPRGRRWPWGWPRAQQQQAACTSLVAGCWKPSTRPGARRRRSSTDAAPSTASTTPRGTCGVWVQAAVCRSAGLCTRGGVVGGR